MKRSIKKAFKIFKYLAVLFTLVYWIGVTIDDWCFIEKYWSSNWPEYLAIWALYFLFYFLAFAFSYWLIAFFLILLYHSATPKTDELN